MYGVLVVACHVLGLLLLIDLLTVSKSSCVQQFIEVTFYLVLFIFVGTTVSPFSQDVTQWDFWKK